MINATLYKVLNFKIKGKEMKKLIMVLFIMEIFLTGCSKETKEEKANRECHDTLSSFVVSQAFIKKRLKSPSTAKFATIIDDGVSIKNIKNCTHVVRAFVDSQNGFGAMIRNNYKVTITYEKDINKWHLDNIEIK